MLWPRRVWWFPGEVAWRSMLRRCAGCGAELPAAAASSEGAAGFSYCSTCRRAHESGRDGARVAAVLAALVGAGAALALPLLRPETGLAGLLLATLLGVALPLDLRGRLVARRALGGPAPRSFGLGRAGAVSEGAALARELSQRGAPGRELWLPPLLYRPGLALAAALALGLAGVAHAWHHPRVWVLSLGAVPLTLSVDGVTVARLDPARPGGAEPLALRLPSGTRRLTARDDAGRIVTEASAELVRGREHLFAPGGADECFWLERTGYGRDTTDEALPLRSSSRFFALEADVDGWLSGSPPPPASDRRSTGGIVTLLRHAPCPRAPEPVRAASAVGP